MSISEIKERETGRLARFWHYVDEKVVQISQGRLAEMRRWPDSAIVRELIERSSEQHDPRRDATAGVFRSADIPPADGGGGLIGDMGL
jgi:hypothetical protein